MLEMCADQGYGREQLNVLLIFIFSLFFNIMF